MSASAWSRSSESRAGLTQDLALALVVQDSCRLTRWSALSIVFMSHSSSSAIFSSGGTLEVAAERVGLERGEGRAETADEALELLGRDHADRRVVNSQARKRIAEGAIAVGILAGQGVG